MTCRTEQQDQCSVRSAQCSVLSAQCAVHLPGFACETNLCGPRHEQRGAALYTEALRVLTTRQPDVEMIALDAPAGVVDEKAAVVLSPDVDLDVSRQRKKLRVGGDDARPNVPAAPRRSGETVRRE